MMLYTALVPLFFLFSVGEPPPATTDLCSFTLTIEEKRFEEAVTPGASSTVPANIETNSAVHGRIIMPEKPLDILYTCTDSIMIATTQPFPFETFMSRDTLYYRAEGRPNLIGRQIDATIDSMLQCIFEGPSLKISSAPGEPGVSAGGSDSGAIVPRSISHQKPDCRSGAYSRLNLPLSLGFFFTGIPQPGTGTDFSWEERKSLPSFSGLQFFPELLLSLRIVKVTDEAITVVLRADTTFENQQLIMPSGEEIDLLEDRIHIGGTIVIDPANGVVSTGELRIDELISYLRPRLSTLPASKRCSYLLRLKIR